MFSEGGRRVAAAGPSEGKALPGRDEMTATNIMAGYAIIETVGFGANSVIYRAQEPKTGREVAIKSVKRESKADDKYIAQVLNEYRHASLFDHVNIVKVFRLIRRRQMFRVRRCLLVMEYVPGRNLAKIDYLEVPALVSVFVQVASALEYLHDRDLVHADVKPNNILVRRDGRVKLIDFGVMGRAGRQRERVQGTMDYAAPEQLRHKLCDFKTDIFNFGATMYKVLSGRNFPSRAFMHPKMKVRKFEVMPPGHYVKGVPDELDDAVMRACSILREERPDSISEVREVLEHVESELSPQALSDTTLGLNNRTKEGPGE